MRRQGKRLRRSYEDEQMTNGLGGGCEEGERRLDEICR